MRLLLVCAVTVGSALAAPAAQAANVSSDGTSVRIVAAPGEANQLQVTRESPFGVPPTVTVRDSATPPTPAGPCARTLDPAAVTCPAAAITRVEAQLGDLDDSLALTAPLPGRIGGGPGNDTLTGGPLADTLTGDTGDDQIIGNDGADAIDAGSGRDRAFGGTGADSIVMRDRKADSAVCDAGRDRVRAEVLDQLDLSCEAVDYGPAGRVGRLRARTGGGRFVPVPGQSGARIDRRILRDVLYLIRRYRVRVGDGYSLRQSHKRLGEHPLGLAVDLYPGAGGSWDGVDRLAKWAEPRQNRPRLPFRWVGYDGDRDHGRGHHLHLSWMHSPGRPGRPVRTVWAWVVRGGAASAIPASHLPRATGGPDS